MYSSPLDTEEEAPGTRPIVMPRGKGKGRVGRGRGRGKGKAPPKPVTRPSGAPPGKRSRISSSGSSSESDRDHQPVETSITEPEKSPRGKRLRTDIRGSGGREGDGGRRGPHSPSSSDSEFDRIVGGLDHNELAELEAEVDTRPRAPLPRVKGTRTRGRKRIKS